MSELETMIRDSADTVQWTADWGDVLRRSGHSRFRTRRAAAVAAVAAVGVVLALPGIGIGGGLNAWISGSRPGLQLHAPLALANGRKVGTISVRANRLFVTPNGRPKEFLVPPRRNRVFRRVPLRWSVDLANGTSARSAVLGTSKGHVVARLCRPCGDGARGTIDVNPRELLALVRGDAVVKTSAGTARGRLRLPVPVR